MDVIVFKLFDSHCMLPKRFILPDQGFFEKPFLSWHQTHLSVIASDVIIFLLLC